MSFKAEVIADSSGKWCGNQLRFTTQREAEDYVRDNDTAVSLRRSYDAQSGT